MSGKDGAMSYTERLAEYVGDVTYESLPPDVVARVKLFALDSFGLGIGATATELGQNIVKMARAQGGLRQSTILGQGGKTSCSWAAWANSSLSNLFDYDDTYLGVSHPGNCSIPPALAIGEMKHVDGKQFIAAIVAAYEVLNRVVYAIYPSVDRAKQLWVTLCGHVFGSMAASSKLLGLTTRQTVNAFGLGGGCAPLPMALGDKHAERPMGFFKNGFGWAAMSGVFWTTMAKDDVLGVHDILDGDSFWLRAGSDRCNFDSLVDGLGKRYTVLETSFKPYSSCRYIHPVADAAIALFRDNAIDVSDIERIRVRGIKQLTDFRDPVPQCMMDAEFSLPHVMAMVALGRRPGIEWTSEASFKDPVVRALANKVRIEDDPEADALMDKERGKVLLTTVEVVTRKGSFTTQVRYPKGSPENPITLDEVRQKFMDLAEPVLGNKARKLSQQIDALDDVQDMVTVAELLARRK